MFTVCSQTHGPGLLVPPLNTNTRLPPLIRFLINLEEEYGDNPYHSSTHAADVLRSLHVILHRGGLLRAVARGSKRMEAYLSGADGIAPAISYPLESDGEESQHPGGDGRLMSSAEAMDLLSLYLAAIMHDFGHLGLTNACLIQSSHPLAVSGGRAWIWLTTHLANCINAKDHRYIIFLYALLRCSTTTCPRWRTIIAVLD